MKRFLSSVLLALFSLLLLIPIKASAINSLSHKDVPFSKATCNLQIEERRLWIDHVSWTRSYIISAIASLEDKDAVAERLLKNQDDIGASFRPYYGNEVASKLSALLREHILTAAKVIDAAKSGNAADLEKYNKLWYKNADDIAAFLSSINPNYSDKVLRDMLHTHLQLLTEQVSARINKDWKADINAYDKGEDHMIRFADILSEGIIKQFPEKFK